LKIPYRQYLIEDFLEILFKIEIESYNRLKLACFLTKFRSWKEERKTYDLERILKNRGIEIENNGQIQILHGHYWDQQLGKEKPAIFYTYLDSNTGLLFCFTDEKSEAIEEILGKNIADVVEGFYYLFIRPNTFDLLSKKIYEENPTFYCNYFTATHSPEFRLKGATRPNIQRTIQYNGDDAISVLDEVKQFYGMIPTAIRYVLPGLGSYQVKNTGIFMLSGSNSEEGRRYLLHIADIVLNDVLILKKITDSVEYHAIPVKTDERTFAVPKMTPIKISFSRKVEFDDAEFLVQSLINNGYAIFNHVIQKGSLIMSGMLTDSSKNNIFTFDVNSERILIAPLGEPTFDGLLRLVHTINEKFDSNAVCEVLEESK